MKKRWMLSDKSRGVIAILLFTAIYLLVSLILVFIASDDDLSRNRVSYVFDPEKAPVIIIDAGHGGLDGGAVSESGILEKDINLGIAKYIGDFCRLSGFECILTRTEDEMLTPTEYVTSNKKRADLIARCEIANKHPDYVFVSIHQNKFPSSKYKGLQVFYSGNNAGSRVLAEMIRANNKAMLDKDNTREIKLSGSEIYVLDNLTEPTVLVECGFLSNAAEAEMLSGEKYRKELAFMIYTSIMQFIFSNGI